jgi:uncharacterized SAM-binding protein YcdF (DUF218 family)
MPLNICLVLLLLGYFFLKRPWGKKVLLAGIVLLLFISNTFIADVVMYRWEPKPRDFSTMPVYKLGVVLTGVTHSNKLPKDRTFFARGADRATQTVQLYKLGIIKKILVSGGVGLNPVHPLSEAESLRDFMLFAGVKEEDIIIETKAKNTYENAVFSEKIINSHKMYLNSEQLLLITSAFHMKRASACFAKVGLYPDTFPVDYYGKKPKANFQSIFQPSQHAILVWHKIIKEWVGIIVYTMVGYI